jgi:mRNA-degrading endonuclease RelE of RelBE toxin-antitoxin system
MKFLRTTTFIKLYSRLPPPIRKKVDRQLITLVRDIQHPGLNARKMMGHADIWEMRVDEHYRMTFEIAGDTIILRKVGTHEIYRKP